MHLVEKQDVLNWDVYMPNLSRNNWEESLFCLFSENFIFSMFSSTLMSPVFMPDDFNVSDVNARHKNGYLWKTNNAIDTKTL